MDKHSSLCCVLSFETSSKKQKGKSTRLTSAPHKANLGAKYGLENLYIKDESLNPTQSFKARGMTAAVSMAKELGVKKVAAPSAGNAAGALSAYAALAGMECHIFVPADTPRACIIECRALGANVNLVDGLITDCGRIVGERKAALGLATRHRAAGSVAAAFEAFRVAEPSNDIRTRSHTAGNDAELATLGTHCALARH